MPAPAAPHPRRTTLAIAVGIAIVLAGFFALVITLYDRETNGGRTSVDTEVEDAPNRVDVRGMIVGADLVKGELSVRLTFEPKGDLLSKDGLTLAKDVRRLSNVASGTAERVLQKGRPAGSTDVVLELFGGDSAEYPFDSHEAELDIYMVTGDAASPTPVPMLLSFEGAWHGLSLDAQADPTNSPGHIGLDIQLRRANTVIGVATFIMLIQLLLASGLVGLAVVLVRGKKAELSMFSWMGAMLFAFPALRNASPGIPPVLGTLSDYLAFFWAESTVALVLVTSVSLYLFRDQK